jgi:hypothetical protein
MFDPADLQRIFLDGIRAVIGDTPRAARSAGGVSK